MNKIMLNEYVQIVVCITIIYSFISSRLSIRRLLITKHDKNKYYFIWWLALALVLSIIYF